MRLDFEHSAERLRIVVGRRTEWSELLDLAFVALFGYVGWGVQYHPAAGRRTPWALFVAGYFIVAHVYHLLWTALGTQVIEVEQGGALRFYGEILGVRATLTKRSNLMEATTPRFEEKESRPLLERFFSKQHRGTITFDEKAKARHVGWDLTEEEADMILEQIEIRYPELQRKWKRRWAGADRAFTWMQLS